MTPVLPDQRFPSRPRAKLRALLVDTVQAGNRPAAPRSRRYLAIGGVAAALVAGGGAVAYSQLGSEPVTDHRSARCYTVAEYSSGDSFPGTTIAEADSPAGPGRVADALEVCAALWRQGFLQPGDRAVVANPAAGSHPVPALVACVLPDGRAAVFPGQPGTCARLHLAQELDRPAG